MSLPRFFSSEPAKDAPKVEEGKKPAELPTFTIISPRSPRDVVTVLHGISVDLDSYRYIAKSATDENCVIGRTYADHNPFYKKDLEMEQRAGHHPNLLRFIGIGTDEEHRNVIVYENGGTAGNLNDWLNDSKVDHELQNPFSSRIRWVEQAISAVAHLHQRNLVHGELIPVNILFDSDSDKNVNLKIANLLTARLDEKYLVEIRRHAFNPFYQKGYRWTSPEEYWKGGVPDQRHDIWQLGILIAALMTFKIPYSACATTYALHSVLGKEQPYTQHELQNKVGPKFANFISQCCELSPEKRPTIKKIVDELWSEVLPELQEIVEKEKCPTTLEAPVSQLRMSY